MARAKLYFTPQQKAEANRRKSAKYYAKNKDSINTKRRDTNEQSGQYYLKKAVSLESRVQAILGGSRAEYCNGLYLEYLKDQEDGTEGDVLLSQHDRFQGISRKFHVYMSGVLNTVGAGDMYNRIHEMEVEVSLTAAAIGDMFCQAALGLDSFREHFNRKLFRFQRP
ncbi:hypothetical protein PM082_022408 [Marasmius tenuissimus]|nr:hypothetical protein PM082_022408 [Marasmius tenuissimus]